MGFIPNSNITIGPYKNVKPHELRIEKSMYDFVDRCKIKVPITSRITQAGQVCTESIETAKAFNVGDKVSVSCGYNGVLKEEFVGFIIRFNYAIPLEIDCEGYSYQLRTQTYTKRFTGTTLFKILEYLIAPTDITLDKNIPNVPIDKWVLNGKNGIEVLNEFKKVFPLQIFFSGKVLWVGWHYTKLKADVKYRLGWNTIRDNSLKKKEAKNREVIVKYLHEKKDGTKVVVQSGTHTRKVDRKIKTSATAGVTGEVQQIKVRGISDTKTLQEMADAKHSTLTFDGYEGKITAFLVPYCEPGYKCILEDLRYPDRAGKYIVESIQVTYGVTGARRIVSIGKKLS
jgi:hypothetical protein